MAEGFEKVTDYTHQVLGEDFRNFAYGYDYVADVFTMIMVSSDQKKILVYTGDWGA